RAAHQTRPPVDDALIAVLNEYRERGAKGYTLTETFFDWFNTNLSDDFSIDGPKRAGKDVNLPDLLPDYPKAKRPVDFVIREAGRAELRVVGLARYDADRGGAQEDDRTGGYRAVINEVLGYAQQHSLSLKLLLLNDGPGLLLGSMWEDYCEL